MWEGLLTKAHPKSFEIPKLEIYLIPQKKSTTLYCHRVSLEAENCF